MKKRDLEDLRAQQIEELRKKLTDSRKKLGETVVNASSGKEKNSREARIMRRDIAQILTIISERAKGDKNI